MSERVHYRVRIRPEAHLLQLQCEIPVPDPAGQMLSLPAWVPGSYLIRDFARHVVAITAQCDGRPLPLTKLDKHSWRCAPCEGVLRIDYEVYAHDLSVRGAHVDTTHAFFDGACVFLRVHGHDGGWHDVTVEAPRGRDWALASAMTRRHGAPNGFGSFEAQDYEELIDHPFEMGTFERFDFIAGGVPHALVLSGAARFDGERLARDAALICAQQIALFGAPPPMPHYVFLATILDAGYGGLEHRASSALHVARDSLPLTDTPANDARYLELLGLISHEYFHTWNVKRIKPARFTPYDLTREVHTELLWVFEGFTSYYDDLALPRARLISREDYLQLLARTATRVHRGSGHLRQSLADSSFDAWTKYYRQDENAPNAIVSYYAKGALVALALDLELRRRSDGACSLDTLMRTLWQRYGTSSEGVPEDGVERLAEELAAPYGGESLSAFFRAAVHGCEDLPLQSLLQAFGVELQWRMAQNAEDKGGAWVESPLRDRFGLGLRLADEGGRARVTHVLDGGAARAAGMAPGDELLALDGLRISAANLDTRLARVRDAEVEVLVCRRDEVIALRVRPQRLPLDTCGLRLAPSPDPEQRARLERWLPGP